MKKEPKRKKDIEKILLLAKSQLGIKDYMLYEAAGLMTLKNIELDTRHSFIILAGSGYKGIIALVLARHLASRGKKISVYEINEGKSSNPFYDENYKVLLSLKTPIKKIENLGDLKDFRNDILKYNTIIDGMVGLGLEGGLRGNAEYITDLINQSRIYTISLDLPSGMDADSGNIDTIAVNASKIIVFQYIKVGMVKNKYLYDTEIIVEDIGIPNIQI